jgi:hypothetical protein
MKIESYIINRGINNIANINFNIDEQNVLGQGLTFVPTPKPMTIHELFDESLKKYFRSLRLRYQYDIRLPNINPQFKDKQQKNVESLHDIVFQKLSMPSTRKTPDADSYTELYISNTEQTFKRLRTQSHVRMNISKQLLYVTQHMKNNKEYIIKPADKNIGPTIVTHTWYVNEMFRQILDTQFYKEIEYSAFTKMRIINDIDNTLINIQSYQSIFTPQLKEYIRQFYSTNKMCIPHLLPKIHKLKHWIIEELQARLIISCVTYITTPLSKWLDALLQPLVQQIPTVTKDSKTFVQSIEALEISPNRRDKCILFTGDISSLYTMIPTEKGIELMTRFLNRDTSIEYLTQLYPDTPYINIVTAIIVALTIVLKNNIIEFQGKQYIQINGTAMGQSCAVVYANIFVYELECELIDLTTYQGFTFFYARFVDDVFGVIINQVETDNIIQKLNLLHSSIKFNCLSSSNEVEFLDTIIYKGERFKDEGRFDIRVHQKITNKYLYIPYNSHHTYHNKIAWIKAELKRYIRNSSSFNDYIDIKIKFYNRLRARGYNHKFLCYVMDSVLYKQRSQLLQNNNSDKDKNTKFPLVFVSLFHPLVKHQTIKSALYLNWNEKMKRHFGKKAIVGYKRSRNMQEMLIRSKYESPPV